MYDWADYSADSGSPVLPLLLSVRSQSLLLAVLRHIQRDYQWLDAPDNPTLWDEIDAQIAETITELLEEIVPEVDTAPVGSVVFWIGYASTIPAKWLRCIGQLLDGVDYPELYAVLPHDIYHGGGTEFTMPSLGESFLRGGGVDEHVGDTGGENNVTLTVAQLPAHTHSYSSFSNAGSTAGAIASGGSGGAGTRVSSSVGSGEGHNNLPPYLRGFWIMKALP